MKLSWPQYHALAEKALGRELTNDLTGDCNACVMTRRVPRPAKYPEDKPWPYVPCVKCRELSYYRAMWWKDFGEKAATKQFSEAPYYPGINWKDNTYLTISKKSDKGKVKLLHTENIPPETIPAKDNGPSYQPSGVICQALKGVSHGCTTSMVRVAQYLRNVHGLDELEAILTTIRGEAEEFLNKRVRGG